MVPIYKVIRVFEYLYQKKYASPGYTLNPNDVVLRSVYRFAYLAGTDSLDFIWNYSVFAFCLYDRYKTTRRITPLWIYNDNIRRKWSERTQEQMYYVQQYKERLALANPLKDRRYFVHFSPAYENKQRLLYRGIARYLHCYEFDGVLYDPGCDVCMKCDYKRKCERDVKTKQGDL